MTDQEKYPELSSNIGKTVDLKFPDGSTMQWEVVDEIRKNEDAEKSSYSNDYARRVTVIKKCSDSATTS